MINKDELGRLDLIAVQQEIRKDENMKEDTGEKMELCPYCGIFRPEGALEEPMTAKSLTKRINSILRHREEVICICPECGYNLDRHEIGWLRRRNRKERHVTLTVSYDSDEGDAFPSLCVSSLGLNGASTVIQSFTGDEAEDIFKKLMGEDDE